MREVVLMGGGKIGAIITEMLSSSGDYIVTVVDRKSEQLAKFYDKPNVKTAVVDATNKEDLLSVLHGKFAVLSACPYDITKYIAQAAAEAKVHYLDLTEDVACTQLVKELAVNADSAFIPQSGLAPGFITIVTAELARHFDTLKNVHMRVGALPIYPSNSIKYNLTWSTEGLINEYCQPCEAIVNGAHTMVPPLEELETFSLDGVTYEAFNTSGGLGTMCETLKGKVENLNYRTVRYPGHRDIMKTVLNDLGFKDRQPLLKEIFESSIPSTDQDVVLVFVNVSGMKDGRLVQKTYSNKIYGQTINGTFWSAIQITTASGICGVLDLLSDGKLPTKGLVKQEDVKFDDFISNRFGQYYAMREGTQEKQMNSNAA
ncbi:saccharopine dehydrogenase family protein [Marinibactrum halimedae]|uniref:Saccharopine dehydrogenase n=1 Tax=Marinibactrum halimedae TaxID=1444977 RepID=A0AA37T220_9GAMM|nr:saccharopine dehydrogenase family protein [Marinibactrum halimedae]MCD9457763.1 saccharopine dehydrogenase family protein [Marinibactrum halimedae]GLS24863.1 saccharopine dehydrogenase [Marinibactrum halimedae]